MLNNDDFVKRVKSFFDSFAQDYNLLYPDWEKINSQISMGIDRFINTKKLKVNKILDLGSGTGIGAIGLSELGYTVTSLDISSEMVKVLSQTANKKNIPINTVTGDILKIESLLTEKYDFIICRGNTITYLPSLLDIQLAFKKIYDKLNTNGLFYLGLRDWNEFLLNSGKFIDHFVQTPFGVNKKYDCYYFWLKTPIGLIHLDVFFYFYNLDNKYTLIDSKKYTVEFFCYSIEDLMQEMKNVGFCNVAVVDIPEEKMDGEEYTIICGSKNDS